jgi:hypothetical protein
VRFVKGQSGNPKGGAKGKPRKTTQFLRDLVMPAAPTIGARQALVALVSVAAFASPGMARTPQLDPEDAMVQEFQSFCLDYYTPAQCTGAVRFILKTADSQYFVQLQYEESGDGFLDLLGKLVKGGETLKASETRAAQTGD